MSPAISPVAPSPTLPLSSRRPSVSFGGFGVKVARRTRGFGTPSDFPICGERGGVPRWGRPIPPGSLAEQAARYGTARFAHDGGVAALARPVIRKGELARVVVVAVPENHSAVLGPQMVASDMPGRRRRPVTAGPW